MARHHSAAAVPVQALRHYVLHERNHSRGVDTSRAVGHALKNPVIQRVSSARAPTSGGGMRVLGAGGPVTSEFIVVSGERFRLLAWCGAVREALQDDPRHYLRDFIDADVKAMRKNVSLFVLARPGLQRIWDLLHD